MLPRGHFVLTFACEEGAAAALRLSPLTFGTHLLYFHPWRPQFNPAQPTGIRIPVWIRFPKLDDLYYRALPALCKEIGEVVWAGKEEDYLKKSSTPRLCILVEDISLLPSSVIFPVPLINEEVEIVLEYEGLPIQCTRCLGVDHLVEFCKNEHKAKSKAKGRPSTSGASSRGENLPPPPTIPKQGLNPAALKELATLKSKEKSQAPAKPTVSPSSEDQEMPPAHEQPQAAQELISSNPACHVSPEEIQTFLEDVAQLASSSDATGVPTQ